AGLGESFLHSFPRAGGGAVQDLLKVCIRIPGEETHQLAERARAHGIYIFGAAFEMDEDWGPQLFFNTAFLINPEGKIILKYRKNHSGPIDSYTTPHDVLEEYVRKYGEDFLFPVVDTPIGRLGCMVCSDGFLPETARALVLNGAEVILFPISTFEPIHQQYHLICRCRAYENCAYVVSPNLGHTFSEERPEAGAGNSIIVDYLGRPLIATGATGETTISALIDIEALRGYRESNTFSFPAWMRNDAYLPSYRKEMHPADQFLKAPKTNLGEEVAVYRKTVDSLLARGIFQRPSE
ncbi:MAG TPA: nitrilase-related carbon-nitrogen hydrolase, partial [Candidatus Acidoferrum sp.]|nr:nitrilase-related carbon-nitrogen hydrolase [Candidatus Acidoferrum sp.]